MNAKPVSDPETFRKEIRNYIFNKVQDQKLQIISKKVYSIFQLERQVK